jgi:hypothetical protein
MKKALTTDGKTRKERIVNKVLYCYRETMLHINLYMALLPIFKSFLLTFQLKEPMVHRLHDELTDIFRHFLAYFIKPEVFTDLRARQLKQLDLKNEDIHLQSSSLFIW